MKNGGKSYYEISCWPQESGRPVPNGPDNDSTTIDLYKGLDRPVREESQHACDRCGRCSRPVEPALELYRDY